MKQFDKYRMVDGITPLAARYFNNVWKDIDLRIASLEEVRIAWQIAVDEVVRFGLARIDVLIQEPLQAVLALSSQAETTSANLEQLRQLAESRTAALAALIDALQADTAAQVNAFIGAASGDIAAHKTATVADITAWKAQRTAELESWVAGYEARLLAARQDIDDAIAGLDSRVAALEQYAPDGQLTLTTSQNIDRDATFGTATYVLVEAWGGGASGSAVVNTSGTGTGGEGAEYAWKIFRIADLPASIAVVIGAPGAGVTATSVGTFIRAPGNNGGDTTFGSLLRALGGFANPSADISQGAYAASKIMSHNGKNGGDGGGDAQNYATYGYRLGRGPGGNSVYGGGGGGAGNSIPSLLPGGVSLYGGDGGDGDYRTVSGAVGLPGKRRGGGGGGAIAMKTPNAGDKATSGAGGPGEMQLTWW